MVSVQRYSNVLSNLADQALLMSGARQSTMLNLLLHSYTFDVNDVTQPAVTCNRASHGHLIRLRKCARANSIAT